MLTVKQILSDRSTRICAIGPDSTVFEAISMMADKGVGALMVMEDEQLVGIISERDYTTKVILRERASRTTLVREIMTANPFTVSTDNTLTDCLQMMSGKSIRHLPVTEDGKVIGMLSIRDLLTSIIQEKEFLIQQLESYINGEPGSG